MTGQLLLPPPGDGWAGGRRNALLALASGFGLSVLPSVSRAGGQLEEPLAVSVRNVLSSAIANSAPPVPEFRDIEPRLAYLRWLGAMSGRLRKRKSVWLDLK